MQSRSYVRVTRPVPAAVSLLVCIGLFRLLLAGRFGLSIDEAHYVLYARNLAWGYFDHPPMVAFLGRLFMPLGDAVFWIRLGPLLCGMAALVLVWRLTFVLYRDTTLALFALALFILLPVHHLLGVALLPDATLNLFWIAGLLTAWQALETGRWRWWLATGVLFGGMLLSKYHGVLFPLCLLCYVVATPRHRRWLLRPHPYLAGLTGLLIFLPNILWNSRHDWLSYAFQLGHGAGKGSFRIGNLFNVAGGQLAAASPILAILFGVAAVQTLRRRPVRDADRYLLCASLPILAFFSLIGLTGKILPHWPAVAWFGAVPLLAAVWRRRLAADAGSARRWRNWGRAGIGLAAFMLVVMYGVMATPMIPVAYRAAARTVAVARRLVPAIPAMPPFDPRYDITNDLHGWDEAAARIEAIRAAMPDPDRTFVFCHRFFMTSRLGVHLHPDTVATSLQDRPSQYWLWFNPPDYTGWDALFVDYHMRWHQGPERYRHLFERLDPRAERIDITRGGELVHRFDVYRYSGFAGSREH